VSDGRDDTPEAWEGLPPQAFAGVGVVTCEATAHGLGLGNVSGVWRPSHESPS
jgi:hypothetical protein